MNKIGNEWDKKLDFIFKTKEFNQLRDFLEIEYKNEIVYPKKEDIFRCLKLTNYNNVSVVILGQDPYHNDFEANGLAFSVNKGIKIPPSLKNIFKELENDLAVVRNNNGDLTNWAKQGVLLLNTILTVRKNSPLSHSNSGWIYITDEIIRVLNENEQPIVFLLWGKDAIKKQSLITNPIHYVLSAPHPSPLSAYRGFFGCKHFSKTNQFLIKQGKEPIDWSL